jgi:hypothetical protein
MRDDKREALQRLVDEVAGYYVRDRALLRAQREMHALLARGDPLPASAVDKYLRSVRRYFAGFEREARAHLRDIERRLAHVSQVQFNLTAERGVAARRVEMTQGVLSKLAELAGP